MGKFYSKEKNFNQNLSDLIEIKRSSFAYAGKGAFAKKDLKKGLRLGEYNGKLLSLEEYEELSDKAYIFEVKKKFEGRYYLFFIDARSGDALKFVNGAYTKEQKEKVNVEAYQYSERIFFRTKREVKKGEELIIDYGDNYWEE